MVLGFASWQSKDGAAALIAVEHAEQVAGMSLTRTADLLDQILAEGIRPPFGRASLTVPLGGDRGYPSRAGPVFACASGRAAAIRQLGRTVVYSVSSPKSRRTRGLDLLHP